MRNISRNANPKIRGKRSVFLVLAIILWLVLAVLIGGRMVDFGDRKTNNILSISLLLSVYFFWLYLPNTKLNKVLKMFKTYGIMQVSGAIIKATATSWCIQHYRG